MVFYLAASPIAAARDADFTHLWAAGVAWLEGAAYSPALQREALFGAVEEPLWAARNDALGSFFYPPSALFLYGPLGALPVHTAGLVMALLNAALGVLAGVLIARLTGNPVVGGVAVVLLYPSFFFAYVLGQNGPLTLCLLVGALVASQRSRPLLAGVLLGLTAWKPSWLFAVSWLWLVLPQGRRVLAGFVSGAVGLTLASLALGGWDAFLELAPRIATLREQGDYPVHLQYNLQRFGPLGWAAAIALVGVTLWKGRGNAPAALVAATLVNPHMHHYDALPALVAVAVLGRWWVIVPFHLAFVASEALGLGAWAPLPVLAMLAVWAVSLFGGPEPRPAPGGRSASPPESREAPDPVG